MGNRKSPKSFKSLIPSLLKAQDPKPWPTPPAVPRAPKPLPDYSEEEPGDPKVREQWHRYRQRKLAHGQRLIVYERKLNNYNDFIEQLRSRHKEISGNIRIVFRYLLGIFLFCAITLGGIGDADLLTSTGQIKLPILNFLINFAAFFLIGPLFMVAATAYLHIFLEYHRKQLIPPHEATPYIFNLSGYAAKIVTWILAYFLTPATLFFFAWKGSPIPVTKNFLLVLTAATSVMLTFAHMRRYNQRNSYWIVAIYFCLIALLICFFSLAILKKDFLFRPVNVANAQLSGKQLRNLDLRYARFNNSNLEGVDLTNRDLTGADFTDSNLSNAILAGAKLEDVKLVRTILTGADLKEAIIIRPQLFDISVDQKTRIAKKWIQINDLYVKGIRRFGKEDLSYARLRQANLFGADLRNTNLVFSDLRGANLARAFMSGAELKGSALAYADLRAAEGLTVEQLRSACVDSTTLMDAELAESLADYIQQPVCAVYSTDAKPIVPPQSPSPRFYAPRIGPIVGHTTSKSARLWIEARTPRAKESESTHIGVGLVVKTINGNKTIEHSGEHHSYFKITADAPHIGIWDLTTKKQTSTTVRRSTSLSKKGTKTQVRLATAPINSLLPEGMSTKMTDEIEAIEQRLPLPQAWAKEVLQLAEHLTEAQFSTFPEPPGLDSTSKSRPLGKAHELVFLTGSNRYTLYTFIGLLGGSFGDRAFKSMLRHIKGFENRRPAQFTLFLGNQVYLDPMGPMFGVSKQPSKIADLYRAAFKQKHIRKLMRSAPVYMILNDHEIEANWSRDRLISDNKRALYDAAIHAYRDYQWRHGPRTFDEHLYYAFECGGFPFFVLDVRTQRNTGQAGLQDNYMLGIPETERGLSLQLSALLSWLEEKNKVLPNWPKFIVSPSFIVPDLKRSASPESPSPGVSVKSFVSDGWAAYPNLRKKLLSFIVKRGIQNVVFLTGSGNFSAVTEISFSRGNRPVENLRAFAVNASPFYWPYPHPSIRRFVLDSKKTGGVKLLEDMEMHYKVKKFISDDSFARFHVKPASNLIDVEFFNRRGKPLRNIKLELSP
jgi:alkaline phosphatase D